MRLGTSGQRRRVAFLASVVLVALTVGGGSAQARPVPSFLQALSAVGPGEAGQRAQVRSRLVRPNLAVLFDAAGTPRDARSLPAIRFELFPDVDLTGVVRSVESPGLGRVWTGTIDGLAESSFFLAVVGDAVTLHVDSPRGVYEVASDASGRYRAVQIDQSRFVDHPADWSPTVGDAARVRPGSSRTAASGGATTFGKSTGGTGGTVTGPTIDVMVVYTPTARSRQGGTTKMQSLIANAVSQTNKAYVSSGIGLTVRLVYSGEVVYSEASSIDRDLRWVSGAASVATTRDAVGADTVTLISERNDYCGMADQIYATASTAFTVVNRSCATANLSFAHELGHLQGARHDAYVDATSPDWAYAHGWVNVSKGFRTIMAYDNACRAAGKSCTRIPYFSNATLTYSGAPLGDAAVADNYRVLNATATTIAGFRTAP